MSDYKQVVKSLLRSNDIRIAEEHANVFDQFLEAEENQLIAEKIGHYTAILMENWKKDQRVRKIMEHSLRIPNATVGKFYDVPFGQQHPVLEEVSSFEWKGLDLIGLQYDSLSGKISGTPNQSGEIRLLFCFKVNGDKDESPFHEKVVILTVNPDPKSLWKNIQSNRDDPYWKEDNITVFDNLGKKNILLSSKRGRSHANVGSFREDDFAYNNYENGWSLVAIADGAGSAKASRKGSALACQALVEWFGEEQNLKVMSSFDDLLKQYTQQQIEDSQKEVNRFVYNTLGKAALAVHKKLDTFASREGLTLKDLSTTLIFVLIKKYEYGYAVMSFGVGDCPIGILNQEQDKIILMNWIDVGEYGGGTRFITMPEIFKNQDFSTRFGFKLIEDFSFLFLMSDGIYDPKFVVEAALEDVSKWKEFIADLGGNNPENVNVQLDKNNQEIEQQLSAWMDFWSPGNHDDRTLAIVF